MRSPQSFNRYGYVTNQPTSLIDPVGMNASSLLDGVWWLWNRFENAGNSWSGWMIDGGGGFPSAFEEIMATSFQDYLRDVDRAFSDPNHGITTEVTCVDGTTVTMAGAVTKKEAAAAGVCTGHAEPVQEQQATQQQTIQKAEEVTQETPGGGVSDDADGQILPWGLYGPYIP